LYISVYLSFSIFRRNKTRTMGYLLKVLISLILISNVATTFQCPTANGSFVNPDNYRTYYSCSNYCPNLISCASHLDFYSRTEQACLPEPTGWQPHFDLTGAHTSNTVFVRQDGYNVFYTIDSSDTEQTFIGRYVNETEVVGIVWALHKINNCVYSFNAQMRVTANKAYCYKDTLNTFSSKCGLTFVSRDACYTY
jgi:hypothetical protein